jgi:hypothetical protein
MTSSGRRSHVEALNHALRDVPEDRIRVHICWGNYEGPHVCDIPMARMFDTLMRVKATYVLFETSNPRHGHEWEVFRDRARDIPAHKVLVPGVVDTTTNFVEHPDLIRQRLERFTEIVGSDRVDRGLGLRLRHLRGLRRGGPGNRLGQAREPLRRRAPGGMIPLVLLPGMMCDARLWAPQMAALGRRTVIHAALTEADTVGRLAARILADAPPASRWPASPWAASSRWRSWRRPRPRRPPRPPRHQPAGRSPRGRRPPRPPDRPRPRGPPARGHAGRDEAALPRRNA